MTKQELVDRCLVRISELDSELSNPPVDYEFFNEFCRMYNFKNINGLLKIPYVDLASALIYVIMDDKSLSDVLDDTTSFSMILEELTAEELKIVNTLFMGFVHTNKVDQLEDIFDDTNTRRIMLKIRNIFQDNKMTLTEEEKTSLDEVCDTMNKVVSNTDKYGYNVMRLIEYYKKEPMAINTIINIIRALKYINEGKETLDFNSSEFKKKYKTKIMFEIVNNISDCRRHMNEEYRIVEGSLRHELNVYKKFLRDIDEAFKTDEIKNYESIIRDMPDEKLKREFLKLVYQHNKLKYEEIDIEYEELTKNSIVNYLSILKSNGIKKDEIDLNKIMRNSCDDLDKMLKILNNIVEDRRIIVKIIEISDYSNVYYFSELKSKNVLGKKAFTNYPNIFDSNSADRKLLDENMDVVNKYGVDFTIFLKHPDILIENNKLSDNLEILKQYNLISKLNNLRKYEFLKLDNLSQLLDKIIELGYEELLMSNLDLLNECNWDRIYVLKSMGLEPKNINDLIEVLRDDKFFISDHKLDLYIENATMYYDNQNFFSLDEVDEKELNEFIGNYEISSRSLSFNGIIISKNKVLRNISKETTTVNELFRAIITGSILSMDEVENIKDNYRKRVYKINQ